MHCPGRTYHGKVKQVGGMSTREFFEDDAGGTFDVTMQLSDADRTSALGMTAQLLFLGDTRKNVLYVPRQALFLKDGKHIVYVKRGKDYEQKEDRDQGRNGKPRCYRGTERRDFGCHDRSDASTKTAKRRRLRNARWRDTLDVQDTGKHSPPASGSISATSNGFGISSSAYRTSCSTGFVHC